MPSDVPRLRYILPQFKGNYNAFMKTLESSCAFDSSDVAQFRLKIVEFGKEYGWKAAQDAFGVKRSTYFLWKQKLDVSLGKLSSLVPASTRPHRVRHMHVDERLISLIKSLREQYGHVGKRKLHIMVEAYAKQLGVACPGRSAIGNIIRRNRYFFDRPAKHKKRRRGCLRTRHAPKETRPGFVEVDSVIVFCDGERHTFVTAMDVVTKFACVVVTHNPNTTASQRVLTKFRTLSPFPVRVIQTDNGSEFLGTFDAYCHTQGMMHVFTYPRSPKINGGIERFNRTIQEEFITRTDAFLQGASLLSIHLDAYLSWYNDKRPHQALGYLSPSQYIHTLQSNM